MSRLIASVLLGVVAASGGAWAQEMAREIAGDIGAAGLSSGATVSVSVMAGTPGSELAGIEVDRPMIPASNMKLLTSAAAIRALGADYAFRTHFVMDADGTLTIVGSGDPGFGDPEILEQADPPTTLGDVLDGIAGAAAATRERMGVEGAGEASGIPAIVVDDRVFDRAFVHPEWPADQLERHYCAPVAGLNVHRNVLSVTPRPSPRGPGARAEASVFPPASWITLNILAETVGDGQNVFRAERGPDGQSFYLRGRIRRPSTISADVTLAEPPLFLGGLLADALEGRGVEVGGDESVINNVRYALPEEPPAAGEIIAWVDTPLASIARRCNTDSANLYAEALLKKLGAATTRGAGSWNAGAAALRSQIAQELGPGDATNVVISDGSGLSRENRVSAGLMTRWLADAYEDDAVRDALLASLPQPGEGTLRHRFREDMPGNRLYAKTGTINGVSTLSGYLIHEGSGLAMPFSILVNDLRGPGDTRKARLLQDRIVLRIDEHLSRVAPGTAAAGGEGAFGG